MSDEAMPTEVPLEGFDAAEGLEDLHLEEFASVEGEMLYLDYVRKSAELDGLRQDIAERKKYARCLFWLIVGWLSATFLLTFACGVQYSGPISVPIGSPGNLWLVPVPMTWRMPDGVALALIGSTTINVIGLFYVVAKYLFPNRDGRVAVEGKS